MSKRLPEAEISRLANSIRLLLADPDAHLSRDARLRWEGALTALEVALEANPSLGADALDLSDLR